MTVDRLLRVNELLRREIGEFIPEFAEAEGIDTAAVTITAVQTGRDLKNARVMVSVMHDDPDSIIAGLMRHRKQIQARIAKRIKLKYTPRLNFKLDASIQKGNRVLDLISKLEQEDALEKGSE